MEIKVSLAVTNKRDPDDFYMKEIMEKERVKNLHLSYFVGISPPRI